MKNKIVIVCLLFTTLGVAQIKPKKHYVNFEPGSGINFVFNDSTYLFKISGMVQPFIGYEKLPNQDADYYFNARRTYFNMSGVAVNEKVDFFLQLDYSRPDPLLDAWIGYHPFKGFTMAFGQKQNIANNREMLLMEDQLTFPGRSLLSTEYSRSGREFGIFLEQRFGKSFGVVPQFSATSGDGRNSFGADSRDIDLGGFKWSGRIDLYPLGYFTPGNEVMIADLYHEQEFKFVIGGAASYNDGASEAVGEGHGDFTLYDSQGNPRQPDYRQVYGDILMKYKGFSLLGEYNVSTATKLEGVFKEENGDALLPTEISQYLALGTGYNVQLGYVTKNGYGLDFRYSGVTPEFENVDSVIGSRDGWTLGASKYFKGNDLKVQAAFSQINQTDGSSLTVGELLFQVIF